MLRRSLKVPEIVFWHRLTSALGDAAITRIRVMLYNKSVLILALGCQHDATRICC